MSQNEKTGPAGRYAPSPSGELHFGSLVAAVASYLQARSTGAAWYMRIEDIDPPRVVPGAASAILRSLEQHGLFWDGPVLYQSERGEAYAQAITKLKSTGHAFDCGCTRKQAQHGPEGPEGPVYPGTCRQGLPKGKLPRSVRLRVDQGLAVFHDAVHGRIEQNLSADVGDFVLRRADGHFAYQLGVVVDDAHQGITEVVRGADLLTSTLRQRYLQHCLGLPQVSYLHVPLVLDAGGEKLSKHSKAAPLNLAKPEEGIFKALEFLGQQPPSDFFGEKTDSLLAWAVEHWDIQSIPRL